MTGNNSQPDYYLNYFQQIIALVQGRYQDILNPVDQQFIDSFYSCTQSAKRLLIRLYLRKGPLFLGAKLSYPEVEDTHEAITELCKKKLVQRNPIVYNYELIELLPIARSRMLFSSEEKIRKPDLIRQWLDNKVRKTCREWGVEEDIVQPSNYESYNRLQLLYFGNSHQTLTEFVLEDIGLFSYEKYSLDKTLRLFDNAEEVDRYLELSSLSTQYHLMREARQWDELDHLAHQVYTLSVPEKFHNKWHRLINRLAYRLEQEGKLQLAFDLFSTNDQPVSRERRVRILYKQGKYKESLEVLESFKLDSSTKQESLFYYRFINKLNSKLSRQKVSRPAQSINELSYSWCKQEGSIEQQACEHFPGSVWFENSLPNSIFGLLFWDLIFMELPGVWHHPFQYAPTDLYEPSFIHRRRNKLGDLFAERKDEWRQKIISHWETKYNIRNPFVHWEKVTLEILLQCFDSFTKTQWLGVFKYLLADIKQNRSGFPDLFQYHEGKARFIEIKGPGDKLQDNQIAWLEVFQSLSIPADVCYVRYRDA